MFLTVQCLPDGVNCLNGTYTTSYSTAPIEYFCLPNLAADFGINDFFGYNVYSLWAFNLNHGWPILIAAAVCTMGASLLFLILINCCTGILIWIFITIAFGGSLAVGILFILQAKGVHLSKYISITLSGLSSTTLIWIGSILIAVSVLLLLMCICLRKRIELGVKAV